MRGHVAKKGNNYCAVSYEGIDPATGKERRRWHAGGPRRIDAERLLNDLVKRRHDGETTTSDRSTLAEYLTERWLPLQATRPRPKTYESYKSVTELHIVPRIGRIRLGRLQADDLDGLYVELLREGNRRGKTPSGLSPASVRYVHRVLRKALGDAHRKGIVTRNVAPLADPPKPSADGRPRTIHLWDATELRRFLAATVDHRHHTLFTIAAKTGMRRGELLGLRWDDVDFERSTITIRRAVAVVGWSLGIADVKTRTGRRTIDISRSALDALRSHRERDERDDGDSTRLVFARPDGELLHPEYVSRTFDRLVAKHGLTRIRFHDPAICSPRSAWQRSWGPHRWTSSIDRSSKRRLGAPRPAIKLPRELESLGAQLLLLRASRDRRLGARRVSGGVAGVYLTPPARDSEPGPAPTQQRFGGTSARGGSGWPHRQVLVVPPPANFHDPDCRQVARQLISLVARHLRVDN